MTGVAAGILGGGALWLLSLLGGEQLTAWADSHFYVVTEQFTGADGRAFQVAAFQWPLLFRYLSAAFGGILCLFAVSSGLIRARAEKRAEEKTLHKICALMDGNGDRDREYPEIRQRLQKIQDAFAHKEQLLQAESGKKDDLVAYLAHDLKTPLTSVIGYLELLKEAPDMSWPQKARYTGIALEKAYRLEHLISEFFEITRYNLHEILIERETVDLSYLMIQMKEEFYPVLSQGRNRLTLEIPEGLTVSADREKLGRVLGNILKNAAAYSYPGTEITVKAEQREKETVIWISNHGRTIPARKLNHIFEKFYRLDDARSSNSGGAGLGLAIAREIILAHGGSIEAESREEITVFTIHLPKH